ncbi:hypothetical protein RvY_05917 [Ramazzottius varieornatus]|uniref:Uncharacterized protein n=1 Tax=Ramazzottius varieornatus TaxID=947166 RepID=A0A1D1V5L9_RAMVA|nr:hypothetical protein RvY_05917 [Ramazzottius varieornatus]
MDVDIKEEDRVVPWSTAPPEMMDTGNINPEDPLGKYFASLRQGLSRATQTAILLAEVVNSRHGTSRSSPYVQDELTHYIEALLDSPKVDPLYLHIVANLSDKDLQDLVITLIAQCRETRQIEKCSAILFSFLRILPAASSDEIVLHQIRETCLSLLAQAKLKSSSYCSAYRQTALMKFLPVVLAQRTLSPSSIEFSISLVPEVVRFYVAAVYESESVQRSHVLIPADNAWVRLFQTLTKIFTSACENLKIPKPPQFWSVWKTSVPALKVWWKQIIQWDSILHNQDHLPPSVSFWLKFVFISFLIHFYDQLKVECGLPERKPFLLDVPAVCSTSGSSTGDSDLSRCKKLERLREVFLLAKLVWVALEEQNESLKEKTMVELAFLPVTPTYMSFHLDCRTSFGLRDAAPDPVPEACPSWLVVQMLARNVALSLSTEKLTAETFGGQIVPLASKLRLRDNHPARNVIDFTARESLRYICDDSEIMKFFCAVIVGHMAMQPVERSSDEFLSSLLVFMQPVIEKCTDLLRAVIAALLMRQKFVFKQFFNYICSPEIIAEIGGLVGRMALELTPEPLTSTTTAAHNTRGAIRGSTDVLQTELQKLAINAISNSNVFLTVQLYINDTKETLSIVLFQQQQMPVISPPRRGRSSALTS